MTNNPSKSKQSKTEKRRGAENPPPPRRLTLTLSLSHQTRPKTKNTNPRRQPASCSRREKACPAHRPHNPTCQPPARPFPTAIPSSHHHHHIPSLVPHTSHPRPTLILRRQCYYDRPQEHAAPTKKKKKPKIQTQRESCLFWVCVREGGGEYSKPKSKRERETAPTNQDAKPTATRQKKRSKRQGIKSQKPANNTCSSQNGVRKGGKK